MIDWLEENRASLIASLVRTPWWVACTCLSSVSETRTLPCPGLRWRIDWMTSSFELASRSRMTLSRPTVRVRKSPGLATSPSRPTHSHMRANMVRSSASRIAGSW